MLKKKRLFKICTFILDFITKYWVFWVLIGTTCGIIYYHIDPGYYFHSIAFQQKQNQIQENQTVLKNEFVNFHNRLGIKFLNVEQIDEARKEFNQVLKVDPLNQKATKGLFECEVFSQALSEKYDPEIPHIQLTELKKENPKDPLPYLYLGDFYYNHFQMEYALDNYQTASKLDSTVAAAYSGMGNVYDNKKQFKLALDMHYAAYFTSPWNVVYNNNVANAYYRLGDYQNAVSWYNMTMNLNPRCLDLYSNCATVYMFLGDLEKARELQEKQMGLLEDNNTQNLTFNQGEVHFLSRSGESIHIYDYNVKKYYYYLRMGLTYYLLGNETKTLEYIKKANDLHLNEYDKSFVKEILTTDIDNLQQKQPKLTNKTTMFQISLDST
jgi:tetratricopeptide (TPR) repeat protein